MGTPWKHGRARHTLGLLPGREEDRVSQNSICEIKLARIRTVSQLQPGRMPINQDHQYEAMFFTVRMA